MKATRIATGSFVFLTLLAFFEVELVRNYWIFVVLGLIPFSIVLLLILCGFALEALFVGVKEAKSRAGAVREALAIPAAVLLSIVTYAPVHSFGIDVFAAHYLRTHRAEMARMEQRAGPGQPAAMSYFEGIPDSGLSIFHYEAGSPLLVAERSRHLVSEPLNWCRTLAPAYYVCSHGG